MIRPKSFSLCASLLILSLALTVSADCPVGDVHRDIDCQVNWLDLRDFAQQWLEEGCSAPACRADLDGVPGVDNKDFALLAGNWMTRGTITLVINEFMAGNAGTIEDPDEPGEFPDWFEIYNYGYQDFDIAGMWVRDDSTAHWCQIPTGDPSQTTVPARGYLLLWADSDPGQGPRHVNFNLGKGSDQIGLYDKDRNPIDVVSFTNQVDDMSRGRLPDGSDNWVTFEIGGATPGRRNLRNPIEIVISEIMYHPGHAVNESENIGLEYIELYNKGADPVSLGGWRFTDGINFAIPGDPIIGVGDHFVVAADTTEFGAKYPGVTNVAGGWDGKLGNSGEQIQLVDDAGVLVDQVTYSDQGEWTVRELGPRLSGHRGWEWSEAHDGGGKSLELINPALPNEHGQNWAATQSSEGTPGLPNTVADDDIAPLIVDVGHFPIIPASSDPVIVTAKIIDESSTGVSVSLHYRIDRSAYQNGNEDIYPQYDPNDYNDVPMYDDGAHGDELAGDGIYGAEIPAQADGLVMEFYVESGDAAQNTRTWPAPSDMSSVGAGMQQVTNALYQVDDAFNSSTWTAGDQPIYYLIATGMEKGRLLDIGDGEGGEANSDAQMNLTFVSVDGVETKARYRVGIRNRGHGSRNDQPNNYRVNFPHDRKWEGVDSINLNTKFTYLQVVGNALFRLAGLVSPEATAVQVRFNGENLARFDREMYGSYVHMEVVDSDFAANHFPDDDAGEAYKCMRVSGYADLGYEGTNPDNYRQNYLKRTNTAANDYTKLIELCRVLDPIQTPDANYLEKVNRVADVDQWLRFLAVNTVLNNCETTLANGNGDDYYMYNGVEDPRFVLIQHDLDSILGIGDAIGTGYPTDGIFRFIPGMDPNPGRYPGIAALERIVWHPEVVHRYYWHLKNLIETTFSPEQFGPVLDNLLGDFVPAGTIQQIMDFVVARNAYILSLIPSDLTVVSDLPQVGGYYATDVDVAVIYGQADAVNTRSVMVNGRPAVWYPVQGEWNVAEPQDPDYDTIVPKGAMWKYFDQYTDLGPDWQIGVDDTGWAEGNAELGYGDGTETTPIGYIVTNPGTAEEGKNITTYFTHTFEVADKSKYLALSLLVRRDDGAIVYLNGTEIARSNMPEGFVDYNTPAAGNVFGTDSQGRDVETLYYGGAVLDNDDDFTNIDIDLLENGTNVLAVEIHQFQNNGADISFDLELSGRIEQSGPSVGTPLNPGINRIIVQAFDGPDGTGNEIDREHIDIWYDDGDEGTISGTLTTNRILFAAPGPWHVTGDIVVPSGRTLLIQSGATLFFDAGAGITVESGGRLSAKGTKYNRIRLTAVPGGANWDGISFDGTLEDNQLAYLDHEFGDAQGESTDVQNARVTIDNVEWLGTDRRVLNVDHPSVICRNSVFPSVGGTEPVHGVGLGGSEYLVFDGCMFGTASGYNDIIDFSGGKRPGPILQLYDNFFAGGGDDALDLDGTDAHIEGTVFMNFASGNDSNSSSSTANAVATDDDSDITIARSIFLGCDHHVLLKNGVFVTAQNNVFLGATMSSINFGEPGRGVGPGEGIILEGNIFRDNATMFLNMGNNPSFPGYGSGVVAAVDNSDLPFRWHYLGAGNIDADPLFVDEDGGDFRLKPDSGAIGTGTWGLDMGAIVPAGAAISREPGPTTYRTIASLRVGGPGIVSYKYSVNSPTGPWSAERAVTLPMVLAGMANGQSYTVYAIGKNSAGVWQSEAEAVASRTWTVDTSYSSLVINEVLAHTHGNDPDIIELYYDGPQSMDLLGMSFTDDPDEPEKFVFTLANVTTTVANPGDHMVFYAAVPPIPGVKNYLGFGLSADGETLYLYDKPNPDGSRDLIDSVAFGPQINDYSIGRVGYDREWKLNRMTFGSANIAQPLGDPDMLKINEWLANGEVLFADDFVELYNPHPLPVSLGGMYMTDDPIMQPGKHRIPDLSFIPPQGFSVFQVNDGNDPAELDFKLSAAGEMIGLFDAQLNMIDQVLYGPQTTDASQGRAPDGSSSFDFFDLPTPGIANSYGTVEVITATLVPENADKYAFVPTSPNDVGETWNSDTDFDDSGWMPCIGDPGGIGYEAGTGYEGFITLDVSQMYGAYTTCYIRIPFTVDAEDLADFTEMTLKIRYDDGFVAYINGVELVTARRNFAGTPQWNSEADLDHSDSVATSFEYIDISDYLGALKPGDNVLAIHGLNRGTGSSDFLMSAEIDVTKTTGSAEYPFEEDLDVLEGLRITELMYNAPGGSNYDFIELKNVSDTPIQLEGVRFLEGVTFEFPPKLLNPGQFVVVVSNLTAFRTYYGFSADVAGQYVGGLDGGGEDIVLTLAWPLDAAIMRFEYDDAWYPLTDGAGHSLHIIDPSAHPATWNDPESWTGAFPNPGY